MKKALITAVIVLYALFGSFGQALAQEDVGIWKDTSPVYLSTETSKGLLILEIEVLPAGYEPPIGWSYRATLPEPDLIVALYPVVIMAGVIEFGPEIFISPFYVGNIVNFSSFYFTEFRVHWRSCWSRHPYWRKFHSGHNARFAKHKGNRLSDKLAKHDGYKGDKSSGKQKHPGPLPPFKSDASASTGKDGSPSSKVRPPKGERKEGVRPPRDSKSPAGGASSSGKVRSPKQPGGVPGAKSGAAMKAPRQAPQAPPRAAPAARPASPKGGGRSGGKAQQPEKKK